MSSLLPCRAGWLLPVVLVLATPTLAQRASDQPTPRDPFGRPPATIREVPGGRYKSHSYEEGILTIRATDGSTRQVQPWADGVVKISYFAPGRRPVADSSVSVVQEPGNKAIQRLVLNEPEEGRGKKAPGTPVVASAKALTLFLPGNILSAVIEKNSLRVTLVSGNRPLLEEASPAFRRQPATPVSPEEVPPVRIDELAGTGVRFALQPGERLYGTGSRALPLDRRGYRLELYNQAHYGYANGEPALNVTLPVVRSSRGYMLLFDHYAAGYVDLGKKRPDALEYGVEGLSSLSYFVITGANQAEILARYTALTGRQPLPPRWALGLIQSRFGYRSQAEMLAVADHMRRENFPLDALVLDLFWFGGTTRQGDFAWDTASFPDPAGMMRDLRAQGVNTILISEPYVMRTSRNDSLVRTQGLVGTTAGGRAFTVGSFWAGPASILDVFKPQARTWLWAQYQRLHEQGAAGWWSDLGEPENHPEAMHHVLGTTRQVHNAYGITWARIFQDNYTKHYPDERLFNLARSGWAGMQRNSVFPWSGDISRTWSGLQAQVPIMLSMGQVGVGYMHSDAGGFGANATQDPELYTRWLQLAALCPIMRPHSDQVVAPEPYTYPEPHKSIVRHYAHLRAELLPYLYTLAAQNTLTGAPLVRTMDFEQAAEAFTANAFAGLVLPATGPAAQGPIATAEDSNSDKSPQQVVSPDDQYLLGPNLLVAPVSQAGQRRRNVYLPATPGGWVDFETNQTLRGGQTVGLPAPLGHIPLLARAGSLVPLTAYRGNAATYRADTLLVRYFPDAQVAGSEFVMYEDDGHSARALTQKHYVTTQLISRWNSGNNTLYVNRAGSYTGAATQLTVSLRVARVAAAPTAVLLGGQALASNAWQFDAIRHELHVSFTVKKNTSLTLSDLRLLTQPATQLDPETLTLAVPSDRTFSGGITLPYVRYAAAAAAPLRIRNERGQTVRELSTEPTAGTHAARWDGLDAQGHPAAPGLYEVELAGQRQRLVKLPQ